VAARCLSAEALDELLELYAGTRLGRQELDAELLDDVEGALSRSAWIEAGRVDKDDVPALPRAILPDRPGRYRVVDERRDRHRHDRPRRGRRRYVIADRSMKIAGIAAGRRILSRAGASLGRQIWIVFAQFDSSGGAVSSIRCTEMTTVGPLAALPPQQAHSRARFSSPRRQLASQQ
jgi:hypothetical protein